ncbi:MAG: hypothetical protein R6X16_02935 [Anaerolineae bacterium]
MKKFLLSTVVTIAVALPGAAMADQRLSERAALGAALGAAMGAYVGAEVAGADGGVIGAAVGGAVGARVTTRNYDDSRYFSAPVQQYRVVEYHGHHRGPRHFCPPGLAKQGRC